jgi:hypothetical protein
MSKIETKLFRCFLLLNEILEDTLIHNFAKKLILLEEKLKIIQNLIRKYITMA